MNMRHIAAVTVLLAAVPVANADIINVPGDQPTIQAGIDAAMNGDEVVVAPGTYFEAINFNGKAITVRSTDPTDGAVVTNTIINGGGNSLLACGPPRPLPDTCPADIDNNGDVGINDFLDLLAAWGPCK